GLALALNAPLHAVVSVDAKAGTSITAAAPMLDAAAPPPVPPTSRVTLAAKEASSPDRIESKRPLFWTTVAVNAASAAEKSSERGGALVDPPDVELVPGEAPLLEEGVCVVEGSGGTTA